MWHYGVFHFINSDQQWGRNVAPNNSSYKVRHKPKWLTWRAVVKGNNDLQWTFINGVQLILSCLWVLFLPFSGRRMLPNFTCTCIYISKCFTTSCNSMVFLARPKSYMICAMIRVLSFCSCRKLYSFVHHCETHRTRVWPHTFCTFNRYMRTRLEERSLPSKSNFNRLMGQTSETCRFIPHYDNGMLPCLIARRTILMAL